MDVLSITLFAVHQCNMDVEPTIEIYVEQLLGDAAPAPVSESIDLTITIGVDSSLLIRGVVPGMPFFDRNRLPRIRPCMGSAPKEH